MSSMREYCSSSCTRVSGARMTLSFSSFVFWSRLTSISREAISFWYFDIPAMSLCISLKRCFISVIYVAFSSFLRGIVNDRPQLANNVNKDETQKQSKLIHGNGTGSAVACWMGKIVWCNNFTPFTSTL